MQICFISLRVQAAEVKVQNMEPLAEKRRISSKTIVLSITVKLDTGHMTAAALTAAESFHPHLASRFFVHCKIDLYGFSLFSKRLNMVMRPANILLAAVFVDAAERLQEAAKCGNLQVDPAR